MQMHAKSIGTICAFAFDLSHHLVSQTAKKNEQIKSVPTLPQTQFPTRGIFSINSVFLKLDQSSMEMLSLRSVCKFFDTSKSS